MKKTKKFEKQYEDAMVLEQNLKDIKEMNKHYRNPIQNAINMTNDEQLQHQMMISDKMNDKSNLIITSNFKMGTIDRLNGNLKDTRDTYGERSLLNVTNDQ